MSKELYVDIEIDKEYYAHSSIYIHCNSGIFVIHSPTTFCVNIGPLDKLDVKFLVNLEKHPAIKVLRIRTNE